MDKPKMEPVYASTYGAVLLDVNIEHENFEVVHWHWTRKKNSVK